MKLYPIQCDINIKITDGNGSDGSVKFNFGAFRLPSESDMPGILERVMKAVPDGYRLMTRHEAETSAIAEKTGRRMIFAPFALADDEEWHDPETANVMMAHEGSDFEDDED